MAGSVVMRFEVAAFTANWQINMAVAHYLDATRTGWPENSTFAAWGCDVCGWIMPNPRSASFDAPSAEVKKAFNKHECQKHPHKTERT
jgi:hypothetical protein